MYEHTHYFTFLIAPLQVTTDEEQKEVDEQEAKCIKIAGLYHFYVKGYNFIAMPSMLESFIKQDMVRIFRLITNLFTIIVFY